MPSLNRFAKVASAPALVRGPSLPSLVSTRPDHTLGHACDALIARPENIAIIAYDSYHRNLEFQRRSVGFERLGVLVGQAHDALVHGAGLKYGDRLAVCLPNTLEYLVLQWAAARSGLVLVTVNLERKSWHMR
jgi:acyl-CoA synthetase (AMP-forming)/AMP-acid ligase II